jgi:hypothetical protein
MNHSLIAVAYFQHSAEGLMMPLYDWLTELMDLASAISLPANALN